MIFLADQNSKPAELFTEEEKELIRPFFTNLDKNVFGLINLPEVIMGTLFSRYSRSDKSVRRILIDEFIKNKDLFTLEGGNKIGTSPILATEKAEQFYDRVLVGYGDDSVAELAGIHVACEMVSSFVGDLLTDSRLGISPLEKSARYVLFDKKVNGEYLWYREPKIMQSKYAEVYTKLMDEIFEKYSAWMPTVIAYVKKVTPKDPTATDRAFETACRAQACDILKNMFTASRLTNIGLYGNGRSFEYLISKMYSSGITEAVVVAKELHTEIAKVLPSFVKRAQESEYLVKRRNDMIEFVKEHNLTDLTPVNNYVKLVEYDKEGENSVLAAMLYPYVSMPLDRLIDFVKTMPVEKRIALVSTYVSKRRNRRDKVGRAMENLFYTFEICSNYGMFRDLHRHRVLTLDKQMLTANLGYDMPVELGPIGLEKEYREVMDHAKDVYNEIAKDMPIEAQYAVPRSYHMRYYIKMNLREVYHLTELRSQKAGHPDYRKIAQQMKNEVQAVHPALAEYLIVDMNEYALARLESEKRIDEKMEKLKQKESELQKK